jgi:cytochrome c oxidase subunit 2
VNKLWSILFGVTMLACGMLFFVAPFVGWWLPEGVSTHSHDVDFLFYVILYITGFFFFLTEALLIIFLYLYAGQPAAPKPARAAGWPGWLKPLEGVLHSTHHVEMAWTLVPAIILLYIAFAQIGTWADVKYQKNMPEFGKADVPPLQLDVSARQFEWRVRYADVQRMRGWFDKANANKAEFREDFYSFARKPHVDDIHLVNELHTWVGEPTVVYLSTRDVIHSFNIPVMRVKQDALPGKLIPVWFTATKANSGWDDKGNDRYYLNKVEKGGKLVDDPAFIWDLPCAELCGWGHYRMIGRVFVYRDQAEFFKWLEKAEKDSQVQSGPR